MGTYHLLLVENVALFDFVSNAEVEEDEKEERNKISEQQKDQIFVEANVVWIFGNFGPFHNSGVDDGVSCIVVLPLHWIVIKHKTSGYVDDDGRQDGRDDVDVVAVSGGITEIWLIELFVFALPIRHLRENCVLHFTCN